MPRGRGGWLVGCVLSVWFNHWLVKSFIRNFNVVVFPHPAQISTTSKKKQQQFFQNWFIGILIMALKKNPYIGSILPYNTRTFPRGSTGHCCSEASNFNFSSVHGPSKPERFPWHAPTVWAPLKATLDDDVGSKVSMCKCHCGTFGCAQTYQNQEVEQTSHIEMGWKEKNRQSTIAKEYLKSSKHKRIINENYTFQFKEHICTITFKHY